jgi:diaminohydroxyphosphoribosylaminopyrimidine deaminase/5-amino-6-(5-phosphoribosylamino)uracil reductase
MDAAFFMRRAIGLAERARGNTATNPLVGAVIVRDNEIIGEGYHHFYGGDHAEIDAIKDANSPISGATMYVSLEPCSHQGMTPPCAQALIEAGIGSVYAAMEDPNPKVAGKGIEMLKEAGIEINVGVCEREARKLNEAYIKYITTGMPFVIVKIAQTLDGRISDSKGYSKWITSDAARERVHQLRSRVDAVMVGANTVRIDNPMLTSHGVGGHNPMRIVLSRSGDLSSSLRLFAENRDGLTVLITGDGSSTLPSRAWEIAANGSDLLPMAEVLTRCARERISSILVEGGRQLFTNLIEEGLVDKYIFVVAPRLLGSGTCAFEEDEARDLKKSINLRTEEVTQVGGDIWMEAYPS